MIITDERMDSIMEGISKDDPNYGSDRRDTKASLEKFYENKK